MAKGSIVTLICPVSNKRKVVPYDDTEVGAPVFSMEETDLDLPVGWGRITIEWIAENPEAKARQEARANMMTEFETKVAADGDVSEENRPTILALAQADLDNKLPEEPIEGTTRIVFPVLSDEAIAGAIAALKAAGFPFTEGV